jgi:hypothetical protein
MNHSPRKRTGGASRRRRAHYLALGLALCDLAVLQPAWRSAQSAQTAHAAAATPASAGTATSGQAATTGGKSSP